MVTDESSCNSYDYGDAAYWDARYVQDAEMGNFDWYQRYSDLRPFVRMYMPSYSSRVLMVGCGNALMSEDMVKDGYKDIVNIDISFVVIDMMRRKCKYIPQLKYMQMDVRDMSFFPDESFDSIIDKGTLDSLMCGSDARISAPRMLGEVSRLLKPGGIYMMITYGDPNIRMPHLNRPTYNWQIVLYVIPRPGFEKTNGSSSVMRSPLEPVPFTEEGLIPPNFVMDDPDSHFIYEEWLMEKLEKSRLQEQRAILENETLRRQIMEFQGLLPSTNFMEHLPSGNNTFLTTGHGHGHGLGPTNLEKGSDHFSGNEESDTILHLGLPNEIYYKRKA
ncbi:hypothetical protein SAY86_010914 [Trapa natans]|uniref:Methyltransferase type 11 domain-containing protein n=1 Tax=Trapa natans TaxID=22666 RepID=A0AAN7R4N4_TRANT|nr:hypothetical protein SAY86_010914 [Trapa natans]